MQRNKLLCISPDSMPWNAIVIPHRWTITSWTGCKKVCFGFFDGFKARQNSIDSRHGPDRGYAAIRDHVSQLTVAFDITLLSQQRCTDLEKVLPTAIESPFNNSP